MTREEAIKEIEYLIGDGVVLENIVVDLPQESIDALKFAIADMKKNIPKKLLYNQGTKYKWIDTVRERGRYRNVEKYSYRDACPNCKKNVLESNYCEHCGQALDWSE